MFTSSSNQGISPNYVVFYVDMIDESLGDLGHLLDIAGPKALQQLSKQMPTPIGVNQTHQPVYIICCENSPKLLRFIEQELQAAGLFSQEEKTVSSSVYIFPIDYPVLYEEAVQYMQKKLQNYPLFLPVKEKNKLIDLETKSRIAKTIQQKIEQNAVLMTQLRKTAAIHFISTQDYHIPLFHSLGVTQTTHAEHGLRVQNPFEQYAMGFKKNEKGILLHPIDPNEKLQLAAQAIEGLSDPAYRDLLLQGKKPTEFISNTFFIPGYLQDLQAAFMFIHCLALTEEATHYGDVIFHINVQLDIDKFFKKMLADHGYTSIVIYSPNKEPTRVPLLSAKKNQEKKLILLAGFQLSQHDYDKLFKIAQCYAGCSGDKTLEKALSHYLIPFYQARPWKKEFVKGFEELAKRENLDDSVINYIHEFNALESADKLLSLNELLAKIKRIVELMREDDFATHWIMLIDKIHSDYNYYHHLPAILQISLDVYHLNNAVVENDAKTLAAIENRYLKKSNIKLLFQKACLAHQPVLSNYLYQKYSFLKEFFPTFSSQNFTSTQEYAKPKPSTGP